MKTRPLKWRNGKAKGKCADYIVDKRGGKWHCTICKNDEVHVEFWTTTEELVTAMAAIMDQYLWNEMIAKIIG